MQNGCNNMDCILALLQPATSMLQRVPRTSLKYFANAKSETFFFLPSLFYPLLHRHPRQDGRVRKEAASPRVCGRCRGEPGRGSPAPPGPQLCQGRRRRDGLRGQRPRRPPPPPAPSAAATAAWKNAVCHFTPAFETHRTKV